MFRRKSCYHCNQPYTEEYMEAARANKSERIKVALAKRRAISGSWGGRKRAYSYDQILELRSQGLSLRKVAKIVGCALATVQRVEKK